MDDFLLDDDMDLQFADGDLDFGDSTVQNQKTLLLTEKTEFKENPMRGVGAKLYLEGSHPDALAREVRQEFIADGMTVNQIKTNNGEIQIDAYYPEEP